MASEGDNRIKVAIRIRGLNAKEKAKNRNVQWKLSENKLWQIEPRTEQKIGQVYTFDHVFGMSVHSKEIFEALAKPIIESCLQGFNGTIFAYGQTSSGKTYTMMGEKDAEGIIPMSINHIFKMVESIPTREFLIRVAYMEIYNEQIHDLLELKNNNLKIHEDSSGQAYVTLKEEIADNPEKVIAVMKKGEKMRRFGVTDINERSSRSHTIFRIVIESRKKQMNDSLDEYSWDDSVQISVLNLVDLAGSERVVQTKATGERFKEGCAINKSLFYLGNVISQLSEGSGQYVNFRDSKLTRILRTSLGGNAHTAIICTITPASVEETISTLSFASRAICVKNEPHVNEIISNESLMRGHAAIVKKLEMELEKARKEIDSSSMKRELEQKEEIISRLKGWIQRDMVQVNSPQNPCRSQRRQTWAASDFKKMANCFRVNACTISEEPNECGFSMETESQSRDSVFIEDSVRAIPGSSNITFGRGSSAGQSFGDTFDHRYSWYSPCSGYEGRYSSECEGIAKRRRLEMEDESDEIAECRKSLQETILRLHGSEIDLQPYTLLELINELTNLVEERKPELPFIGADLSGNSAEVEDTSSKYSEKIAEYEEKLVQLQQILTEKIEENTRLVKAKEDFESFLTSSQGKCKVCLNEELSKIPNDSKKEESSPQNISLQIQPNDKNQETEKLACQLKEKEAEINTLRFGIEELKAELIEERRKLFEIEVERVSTLASHSGDENSSVLDSVTEYEQKIEMLEVNLVKNREETNKIMLEKEEYESLFASAKEKYRMLHLQLGEALTNLGSASEKIIMYEQRIAELEEKIAKNVLETSNLVLEKEEFESLFVSSKQKYKVLERKLDETLASLDGSQNKLDSAEHLNELILELKKELISKESEMGLMNEKIEKLHAELSEKRATIVEMEQKLTVEQNSESNNEYKEIEELLATNSAQANKIAELQVNISEIENLKSNMSTMEMLAKEGELLLEEERKKSEYLKEEISQLRHELKKLKAERDMLLTYQQDDNALSQEIEALRSSFEKCKSELLNVELEREDLISNLASKEQQNEYLQNQLSNSQSDIEMLSKQLAEVMSEHENFKGKEAELLSLRAELEQAKFSLEFCAQSEEELDNLLSVEKNKVRDLQNELNKLKKENEKLLDLGERELTLLECKKSLQISLEDCKSELSNVILEKNDLTSSLETVKIQNITLQNQLINAQMDIDTLSKKLTEIESQYESIKDKDSELESLKAELENAKCTDHAERGDLDNLLSIERIKVSNLQMELSKASAEKNDLWNEKNKLTESLEKIEHELASLVDEHDKCSKYEKKMIELEEALLEASKSITNLRKEKELELENERKMSEKLISEKDECINSLLEENKTISEENISKLFSLEKMLEAEITKCAEKTEEMQSLTADKDRVEEMLKAEKDKVTDLERQLAIDEEKLFNLKLVLEEQVKEKERLRDLELDLQRKLSHKSMYEKELENKNLKLMSSVENMESQLQQLKDDRSTLLENNTKLTATNDGLSTEVDVLNAKLSSYKLEVEKLEASLNSKENMLSQMKERNEEMLSLLLTSNRRVSELEKDVKEMTNELHQKVNEVSDGVEKITELQISLEEAHSQIGVMTQEISQLEGKLQNLNDERNQTVINEMEEQIASLKEDRKAETETYEEKIATLERLLSIESKNCALKTTELDVLKMNKSRLEEMLLAEKERVLDLEKQIVNGEEKLMSVKDEIDLQRQENDRLKVMEMDLTSRLELEKQKNVITESELDKLRLTLSSSEINLNQLKSEVESLKKKLMEETTMVAQLQVLLDTEKQAYLAAKEAEGRLLSALSAQEAAKSVLSSGESISMAIKTESSTAEEKDKIKELMEKIEDQEKYIAQFDKTIEKMERRYNLTLDFRLEVQKKAKEREAELLSEINELQKKISQDPKTEEAKHNLLDLEKEIYHAKLKIEETEKKLQTAVSEAKSYHSQASDYKRELLRCKQLLYAGVTRTEAKVDCGIQTVPVEVPVVEDIRPSGSGIVQYYKIDCLERQVKALEKEKEFLKKLCRRRHDQREELKLKLELLTGKVDVDSSHNKENDSVNV